MELNTFIENFANQFEETPRDEFKAHTVYKNIGEWNSLMLLTVIAMIDEEYHVSAEGGDFKDTNTIEDLFILVKNKK